MAAHYTIKQLEEINSLRESGMSYKDIAIKLGRVNKKGQPNERSIMEALSKFLKTHAASPILQSTHQSIPTSPTDIKPVLLNDMTRNERSDFLEKRIGATPRTKYLFDTYSQIEKELFIDEYKALVGEIESLTAAEEQQLFLALNNFVLAMRAQKRDKESWDAHQASLKPQTNTTGMPLPQQIKIYDTRFTQEYDSRMEQYASIVKQLKMSREQRLKDIAKIGNSFLDFAESLSKKENQLAISDEILALEKKSEEELKILQQNGWVVFGKSPNNNFDVNYEKK